MELTSSNVGSAGRRYLPWLGLLCILASFVIAVVQVHPTNFFGLSEDDSIYFSSAKALAEGKGYVLESFPGTPAATKYPVFYPWVLSWVWRWNPSFPANLRDAIAVTVAFGVLYVTAAFLFFRRLKGLCQAEALALTAFCALHPLVIFYSGRLLTEIPFAALALAAMVLAEKAAQREETASVAACGVLTGLAILTRVLGVPIAAGIAVAFAARRAWRQLAVFCGCVAPFFGALAWRVIFSHAPVSPVSGAAASTPGWIQTWTYYTNYLNVWKEGVPNTSVFLAMLQNNALWLLRAPADYFVSPWPATHTLKGQVLAFVVTGVIVKGILRMVRDRRVRVIHWVLPFYGVTMLLWNFPEGGRFLIPFLPLFAAALWVEIKYLLDMVDAALTGTKPIGERLVALGFGAVIALFIGAVSFNYAGGLRKEVAAMGEERAALLREKREAYEWLARSTDQNARAIAYEDASLYLYTGRVAARPIAFTTAEFYERWRLEKILEHMTDVAQAIKADYWLVSADDFNSEWPEASAQTQSRIRALEKVLPLVYSSAHGHVRIYSLDCLQPPKEAECDAVAARTTPPL